MSSALAVVNREWVRRLLARAGHARHPLWVEPLPTHESRLRGHPRAFPVLLHHLDELLEEVVGIVRAGAGLDSLGRDLTLAVRQLRRAPAFAAAVVATLALAIGANAAVFSVIQAVLLAPPAYRERLLSALA